MLSPNRANPDRESELPQNAAQLDQNSLEFNSFFREAKDRILRTVIVSTGNQHDAEDCVAEAFRRALESWELVQKMDSPAAWVVRVAKNIHTDRQRRHIVGSKHLRELVRPDWIDTPKMPVDPKLILAVNKLPERQRQVLAYRVLLELTPEETAEELSISAGTVGAHLHRALKTLRTQMPPNTESE